MSSAFLNKRNSWLRILINTIGLISFELIDMTTATRRSITDNTECAISLILYLVEDLQLACRRHQ